MVGRSCGLMRMRWDWPARINRSLGGSTRVSMSTVTHRDRWLVTSGSGWVIAASEPAASARVFPSRAWLRRSRKTMMWSASHVWSNSTWRWSTRPVSVMSTSSSRVGVSDTTSQCFTWLARRLGSCTMAVWRVNWLRSCAERCSTSSRLTPSSRKVSMVRRSASERGLMSLRESTNSRYPFWVGSRPELACCWLI